MAPSTRIAAAAALSFLAAFAAAEITGVRALGGAILLAGAALCTHLALPTAGRARTAALLGIALALFVLSHPLGDAIGAWPAVTASAAVLAAAALALTR